VVFIGELRGGETAEVWLIVLGLGGSYLSMHGLLCGEGPWMPYPALG